MIRAGFHIILILGLTALTQLGGAAWLFALLFRRRIVVFLLAYGALSGAAIWVAPNLGRVAASCFDDGALQVQSGIYCALNRTYVSPEMADVLADAAARIAADYPGSVTLLLDGNFPFWGGFPLLPHLSHDDGEKADLALYYRDEKGYLPGRTRSPLGYFAFEQGPTACPEATLSLRWDLTTLQRLWADYALDEARTRRLLAILIADARVGKIFVEPHLAQRLKIAHPKIRFQGCRAARHDDHIHVELK